MLGFFMLVRADSIGEINLKSPSGDGSYDPTPIKVVRLISFAQRSPTTASFFKVGPRFAREKHFRNLHMKTRLIALHMLTVDHVVNWVKHIST